MGCVKISVTPCKPDGGRLITADEFTIGNVVENSVGCRFLVVQYEGKQGPNEKIHNVYVALSRPGPVPVVFEKGRGLRGVKRIGDIDIAPFVEV